MLNNRLYTVKPVVSLQQDSDVSLIQSADNKNALQRGFIN